MSILERNASSGYQRLYGKGVNFVKLTLRDQMQLKGRNQQKQRSRLSVVMFERTFELNGFSYAHS